MKIKVEQYNPLWKESFNQIKVELSEVMASLNPQIEHIGGTAVEGLSAKSIIDILIGVDDIDELNIIPALLMDKGYVYYENYNEDMPYRRFFVNLTSSPLRSAHIHVLQLNSVHWIRHIAFRDYLRTYPGIKTEYQLLKEKLSQQEWKDGNDYNEGKNSFLKNEERKAIKWYKSIVRMQPI
ncbi:GrpB family protein [Pedobacter cryoconitis]|nr:GrpB family protein [Pedobacter cryoconitis]MBB5645328.1 GrpB-like predicted nucleotidyltransferase (UPF0157 family) [Pedobacter cryoconitis]